MMHKIATHSAPKDYFLCGEYLAPSQPKATWNVSLSPPTPTASYSLLSKFSAQNSIENILVIICLLSLMRQKGFELRNHLFKYMSTVHLAQCLPCSMGSMNVWGWQEGQAGGRLKKQWRPWPGKQQCQALPWGIVAGQPGRPGTSTKHCSSVQWLHSGDSPGTYWQNPRESLFLGLASDLPSWKASVQFWAGDTSAESASTSLSSAMLGGS